MNYGFSSCKPKSRESYLPKHPMTIVIFSFQIHTNNQFLLRSLLSLLVRPRCPGTCTHLFYLHPELVTFMSTKGFPRPHKLPYLIFAREKNNGKVMAKPCTVLRPPASRRPCRSCPPRRRPVAACSTQPPPRRPRRRRRRRRSPSGPTRSLRIRYEKRPNAF